MPCLTDYLISNNVIGALSPMLMGGDWYVSSETGKVCRRRTPLESQVFSGPGSGMSFPWLFHHFDNGPRCAKFLSMFNCLGIIPSFCRSRCHQVIARPETLSDLLRVNEFMKQIGVAGKCGIERDESVPHNYGAYWYCDGEGSGLEIHDRVSKAIGHVPVTLARACLEMEMKHGPAHSWSAITESEEAWESIFDEIVDFPEDTHNQPDYLRNWIVLGWVRFAWQHGDRTVSEHTPEGKPLLPNRTDYSKGR